jgi:hypothetical protein
MNRPVHLWCADGNTSPIDGSTLGKTGWTFMQ